MVMSLLWGFVAAVSLFIGAVLGVLRKWPNRLVGSVLAFGGGALIASISFELAEEGLSTGGPVAVGVGLAIGALVYFTANKIVENAGTGGSKHGLFHRRSTPSSSRGQRRAAGGTSLALGAFLDGIPEQAVLGIGLAAGEGVSVALLIAIFVSNLPEAIGSASDMRSSGTPRSKILLLWAGVTAVCALATLGGYLAADLATGSLRAAVNGFAAGALLVMLTDSLVPEAREKAGELAGLITVLGFALAAGLSLLS